MTPERDFDLAGAAGGASYDDNDDIFVPEGFVLHVDVGSRTMRVDCPVCGIAAVAVEDLTVGEALSEASRHMRQAHGIDPTVDPDDLVARTEAVAAQDVRGDDLFDARHGLRSSEPDAFLRELEASNVRETRVDALCAAARFASLEQQYHALGLGNHPGASPRRPGMDVAIERVLNIAARFESYILYGEDGPPPQDAT